MDGSSDVQKPLSGKQIPLLRAYLHEVPAYPPHVPTWIPNVGWILFFAFGGLSFATSISGFGVLIAGVLSYLFVVLARKMHQPRNAHERSNEERFEAIRKLKGMLDDGLHRRLPPEVLLALERAVEARNLALANIAADEPLDAGEAKERIERGLQLCFVVAKPVMRGENCSRGEWETLLQNRTLIAGIVDTIERKSSSIRNSLGADKERLAALHELEGDAGIDSLSQLG